MNEKQFRMFLLLYSRRDSVKQFDPEEAAEMDRKSPVHSVWDPASQSMELFCQLQKQWLHKLSQGGEKQNARDALAVRKTQ